jgi:hypothetical protein
VFVDKQDDKFFRGGPLKKLLLTNERLDMRQTNEEDIVDSPLSGANEEKEEEDHAG